MNIKQNLIELNKLYFKEFPEDKQYKYWSGCNYWICQGKNKFEPIGSAWSMYDCHLCDKVDWCKAKRDMPIWEWNKYIEKNLIMWRNEAYN